MAPRYSWNVTAVHTTGFGMTPILHCSRSWELVTEDSSCQEKEEIFVAAAFWDDLLFGGIGYGEAGFHFQAHILL